MIWDGLTPPYGCIAVDPPWRFDITQRLSGKGRRSASARARYSTLTPHEIAELPVNELAASSAHCWLWCTSAVLATGAHRGILEHWGFRPITTLTWTKPGDNGLGRYLRGSTEHAVLAVKGWGTVPAVPHPTTWFQAARTAHSVKPGAAFDIIEQVSPGPYVELFARQQRLGWSSWGMGHEIGASA
jgi:N6-adenosine-specific RNA methylase IME4